MFVGTINIMMAVRSITFLIIIFGEHSTFGDTNIKLHIRDFVLDVIFVLLTRTKPHKFVLYIFE